MHKSADMQKSLDASARPSRLGQWLIGLFILLGGAGVVWYYDVGQAQPAQQGGMGGGGRGGRGGGGRGADLPPVRVVEAESRNIGVALKALGTVTPVNTVTCAADSTANSSASSSPKANA